MPSLEEVLHAVASVVPPDDSEWAERAVSRLVHEEDLLKHRVAGVHVCELGVDVAWWGNTLRARVKRCEGCTIVPSPLYEDDAKVIADPDRYYRDVALPRWRSACRMCGVELPKPALGEVVSPARIVERVRRGRVCVMCVWWHYEYFAVLKGVAAVPMGNSNRSSVFEVLGLRNMDEAAALVRVARRDAGVVLSLARDWRR